MLEAGLLFLSLVQLFLCLLLIGSLDGRSCARFLKKTCGTRFPMAVWSMVGFPIAVPVKTLRLLWGRLNNCFGIWPKLWMKDMTAFLLTGSSIVSMSEKNKIVNFRWWKRKKAKKRKKERERERERERGREVYTYSSFIKQWMEYIVSLLCILPLLLITEYQINPLMKMSWYIIRLQCLHTHNSTW